MKSFYTSKLLYINLMTMCDFKYYVFFPSNYNKYTNYNSNNNKTHIRNTENN